MLTNTYPNESVLGGNSVHCNAESVLNLIYVMQMNCPAYNYVIKRQFVSSSQFTQQIPSRNIHR